jgi:ABC-type transport system substrate-binding protein
LNAQDIVASWNRFETKNPLAGTLSQKASRSAPVTSVTAPDANTVIMKTAYPSAPLLPLLAYERYLIILPVEADNGFDTGRDQRGSGPWRVKEHLPGARLVFESNPDWYDASKVLLGGWSRAIVSEYASELAQFRAGNIPTAAVQAEDVLQVKRDVPQLLMIEQRVFDQGLQSVRMGFKEGSIFRDTRVRQATSMLMDRDLVIDTFSGAQQFKDAGLNPPRRWHSSFLPPGYDDYWLDPQDEAKFGPNAKFLAYNPAEARKLVEAASGGKLPLKGEFAYCSDCYDENFVRLASVLHQMWTTGGILDLPIHTGPDQTDWRPNYNRNSGQHMAITLGAGGGGPDVDVQISGRMSVQGNDRVGHVGDDGKIDQYLEDLILKQRQEVDLTKRVQLVYEIQRHNAKQQYVYAGEGGSSLSYNLGWPWLGNFQVYQEPTGSSAETEVTPFYWIDESKRKA